MKKYLAIDSGGSKTAAILYDEDLNRLAVTTAGSMRTNTTADDLYEKHLQDLVGSLGLEGETIEQISGVCESRVTDRIKEISNVKSVEIVGEHELGFPAAGVLGDGILALCGTGATVFARYQGQSFSLGGYGAAVSDEGSGYYIGRKAYNAAIRDYEGRGPRTQLTQKLVERLGFSARDQLRGAIFSIYANADRSPVATVASFVPDVVRAASLGDAEAQRILTLAGGRLGDQVMAMIRMEKLPKGLPLALSGSVWRGNPYFYDAFVSHTEELTPVAPKFEPVIGVLIRTGCRLKGSFGEKDFAALYERYPEFRYDLKISKER